MAGNVDVDVHYTVEADKRFGGKEVSKGQSTEMNEILCPMPSTITRIAVKNGDRVKKGDVLLVIEAMKMEVGDLREFHVAYYYCNT